MSPLRLAVTLAFLASVGGVGARDSESPVPVLSPKEVSQAIDRASKLTMPSVCIGRYGAGEFTVCIQGPEQRIAAAATLAKQSKRKLKPADLAHDIKARTWLVVVRPRAPGLVDGRPTRTPPPEHLTFQALNQSEAGSVQPLQATRMTYSWDNAVGVTLKGEGLTATFDPRAMPPGDLEVVVTTDGTPERRYYLSDGDRSQIR